MIEKRELREHVMDYRVKHGLTQVELAKLCGVSRVTIGTIEDENRYTRPNLNTIHKIMKVVMEKKENDRSES